MRCPNCGERDTRVVDSRDIDDAAIRRRRECNLCATALHHLRAHRVGTPDGRQERRQARGVRSREARHGPLAGPDPSPGS